MIGPSAAIIRGRGRRVIVVGSGVSGLSAVLDLVRSGISVLQISSGPARQAPSARSQEGIAVAIDRSPEQYRHHREANLASCSGRAAHPLLDHLVEQAPALVEELAALGVPFFRDPSGELSNVAAAGWHGLPTVFSGATTGQQVVAALEHQVRGLDWSQDVAVAERRERLLPLLDRLEYWDVLGLIQDEHGVVIGALACDQRTLELRAFAADAVCLATGGAAGLFGLSGAFGASGAAMGAAIRAGAMIANLGRIAWEPTCLDGSVKRPLGSLLRSLGARLWSPRGKNQGRSLAELADAERDEWSEDDDTNADALREALCQRTARGVPVFLEVSHLDPAVFSARASWALELIRVFGNEDPWAGPVPVVPCPAGSRGGLWVDCETDSDGHLVVDSPRSQATTVPGLYAAGGVEWLHGQVGALPGNRLSAGLLAGRLASAGMVAYQRKVETSAFELPQSVFDRALKALEARLMAENSTQACAGGGSVLEIQRRLVSVVARIARAQGSSQDWRDALTTLEKEMSDRVVLDPERRQSPEHRAALHWDGLCTMARTLLESAARECESGAGAGCSSPTVMMRWSKTGIERVDGFEYQCAGRTVAISSETGTPLTRTGVSTERDGLGSNQGRPEDEASA